MRRVFLSAAALIAVAGIGVMTSPKAVAGQQDKLDAASLKTMIEGLGFETKMLNQEAGKEKYELKVTKGGFDIPLGAEISPSTNYIWLTVSLGEVKPTHKFDELLRQNGKIQPSFFYITTKNFLMMAIAMDNRNVNPALLKRNIEKVTEDVSNNASLWQVP